LVTRQELEDMRSNCMMQDIRDVLVAAQEMRASPHELDN
jgi:hypothetical protein